MKDGEKILPSKNTNAKCPLCISDAIPKCGKIKVWHWAHKSNLDCDSFGEPESQWHLDWKNEFPKEQQEVTIKKCVSDYCYDIKYGHNHQGNDHGDCTDCINKIHRADIKINNLVVELQNSNISPEQIIGREEFYGKMVWVLNGKNFADRFLIKSKKGVLTFRWKHPLKSFWSSKKPIYIDFCDVQEESWTSYSFQNEVGWWETDYMKECEEMEREIFLIKKIYQNTPCGGWGILISKKEFLKRCMDGTL